MKRKPVPFRDYIPWEAARPAVIWTVACFLGVPGFIWLIHSI